MSTKRLPSTLLEATRYFADPNVCVDFVASLRWPNGPVCPKCEGTEHSYLTTRRLWKCKACKHQFSVKVGTIFEDSPIPLDKWLCAIWLIANAKNGVSSHELGRSIGLSQKSAWFVLHRIRLAMEIGNFDRLGGEGVTVEADETYVGGSGRFMHKSRKVRQGVPQGGWSHMTTVAGALERNEHGGTSRVRAAVIEKGYAAIASYVKDNVAEGSTLYSDRNSAYGMLGDVYDRATVNHMDEYVRGRVHSNGIENFWMLLKRGLKGTYVYADPKHLDRYVDERVFTFNERGLSDFARFCAVLVAGVGRRLTWAQLVG